MDGIVSGLERSSHVDGHLCAPAAVEQHDVVEIVRAEEECLSDYPLIGRS